MYTFIYTFSTKQGKLKFSEYFCYCNWWHWSFLKIWNFVMVCQRFFSRKRKPFFSFYFFYQSAWHHSYIYMYTYCINTTRMSNCSLFSVPPLLFIYLLWLLISPPSLIQTHPLCINFLCLLRYYPLPLFLTPTVTNAVAV